MLNFMDLARSGDRVIGVHLEMNKQTFSHDFASGFPPRSQLRSSAREQEKNLVFVREKEEDF
jgi:hypothetical protein